MDTSGNWHLGLALDSINYWQLGEQPARDEEPIGLVVRTIGLARAKATITLDPRVVAEGLVKGRLRTSVIENWPDSANAPHGRGAVPMGPEGGGRVWEAGSVKRTLELSAVAP